MSTILPTTRVRRWLSEGTRLGRLRARRRLPAPLRVGLVLLAPILIVALWPQLLTSADPSAQDIGALLLPPSLAHPFGTDNFGRDVFTRVLYGTRIDLQIGFFCVIGPVLCGTLLGALAGYAGGWFDSVMMRLVEVVVAFPFLVLVIAIVAALGPGLLNLYLAVSVVGWIAYARLVRGEVLVVKQTEYVQAAQLLGFSSARIVLRHVLPNVVTPALVFAASDFVLCMLLGASLGFLGLGAQPPTPEWGTMLAEGRGFLAQAWWMATFPGLAIMLVGLSVSLLGDGLADLLRVR